MENASAAATPLHSDALSCSDCMSRDPAAAALVAVDFCSRSTEAAEEGMRARVAHATRLASPRFIPATLRRPIGWRARAAGIRWAQVSVSEARPVWWTGACRQCHGWWWYLEAVCIYDGCGLPTGLLTTDTHSYDLVSAIVYFVFNCTLVLSLSLNTLLGRILFRDGVAKCKYITHIF
jgi:hypothetical protein